MIINFGWMDALRRLTLDIVCFIDAKGFGGIIKLSSSPSNILITFFMEGRSIKYHRIHQSPMMLNFFAILI